MLYLNSGLYFGIQVIPSLKYMHELCTSVSRKLEVTKNSTFLLSFRISDDYNQHNKELISVSFDSNVSVAQTLVPVSFDKIGISLVSKETCSRRA